MHRISKPFILLLAFLLVFTTMIPSVGVFAASTGNLLHGLKGEYYLSSGKGAFDFYKHVATIASPNISFGNLEPILEKLTGQNDDVSVRWTGQIEPKYTEDYTFSMIGDNGFRLWIDNKLIIDHWVSDWDNEQVSKPISLEAGQKYDIKIEYFEDWGGSHLTLRWSSTSQKKEIVPSDSLYLPEGAFFVLANDAAVIMYKDTVYEGKLTATFIEPAKSLTYSVVESPVHGTVTANADGTFSYTPEAGYLGDDRFTFKANDGTADSSVATISINVMNNEAPIAHDASISFVENTTNYGMLTATDLDTLTYRVVENPEHGSVKVNEDGSFTYTPITDYNGSDSFTFKANDGKVDSNIATISISVKNPQDIVSEAGSSGNPIFDGWYADPDMAIYNNLYWVFPTTSSSYELQTHLDAFSSADLVNWTKHSNVLTTDNISWAKKALWAPAPIERNGKYYLYFGANDIQNNSQLGGIGVAVADKPEGPYVDAIGEPLIKQIVNGAQPIDQDVFIDDDGQAYMYYGGWGRANVVKLNEDMISLGTFEDGSTYKEITPENYTEGSLMFKRNGKYYLMWSEGGWTGPDYSVSYAIADSPLGPFKKINRILKQDPAVAKGSGHNTVINVPGTDDWYIFYHRRPLSETDGNHRVVSYEKMEFNSDGTIKPIKMAVKDNFSDKNYLGWKTYGGSWTALDEQFAVSSDAGAKALLDINYSDLIFEADVTVSENGNSGLVFRVANPDTGANAFNGYYVGLNLAGQQVELQKVNNNSTTLLAKQSMTLNANTVYHIKVIAVDSKIYVFVDDMDEPKLSATDSTFSSGKIGVRTENNSAKFDNILADNEIDGEKIVLKVLIEKTQALLGSVEFGTEPGQYGQDAVGAIETAIADAQAVVNNRNAAKDEINQAIEALNNSIILFEDQINPPISTSAIVDQFDSDSLSDLWSIYSQTPDQRWSLTKVPGKLYLRTTAGDSWQDQNKLKNVFLRTAPSGDFEITTKLTAPIRQNHQQAGLYIWEDEDNYVRLGHVWDNGYSLETAKEQNRTYIKAANMAAHPGTDTMYLKMKKVGNQVTTYYWDKKDWIKAADPITVTLENLKIGLYGTSTSASDIDVTFDYFTVESLIDDLSPLQDLIVSAKDISNYDGTYTDASFTALQEAIVMAEAALNTIERQAELDAAIAALQTAIDGLEASKPDPEPVDVTELEQLIATAKAVTNEDGVYTDASFAALRAAIATAEAALGTIETEEELEAAISALKTAIDGLEVSKPDPEPVDVTELEQLIATAKAVTNEDGAYTDASFEALQAAIASAEAALGTIETEEELEAAIAALQTAIDGLEASKPDNGQDPSDGDNTPGNMTPGNGEQTPGNGNHTPGNGEKAPGYGNKLPSTATNQYNYLLLGIVLLIVGGITAGSVARRKNQ